MSNERWTDARIDHELADAFALTGGDVDGPTFRAVYNRIIGLRNDMAAQLQAAQQRIETLESQFANWQHMLGTSEQTADAQWVDAQTEVIARLKQRIAELEAQ